MADRQPPRANASNPIPIPGSGSPFPPQHHPPRDCYFPKELKAAAEAAAEAAAASPVESQPNSGPSSPRISSGAAWDNLQMSPEPSQPGSPSRIPDGMHLHPLIDPRPVSREIREKLENLLSCSHSANVASSSVGVSSNVTVESSSVGVSSNVAVASSFSGGGRELTSEKDKVGGLTKLVKDPAESPEEKKDNTSKAERHALQESQQAAEVAAQDESNKTSESRKQRVVVKQTQAEDGDKASESDKRRDGDQLGKAPHS